MNTRIIGLTSPPLLGPPLLQHVHSSIWGFLVCFAVGDLYQDRYVNGGHGPIGPMGPMGPMGPYGPSPMGPQGAHGTMGPRLGSVYATVLG